MKIVGCQVLRTEIEHLLGEKAKEAQWLSPGLHVDLALLKENLGSALEGGGDTACFYGACHPQMDEMLDEHSANRIPGKDCVAFFLGEEERKKLEGNRALVITPGWLRHWREIFQDALNWDEIDARQNFGFYDTVVILDFGLEPLDDMEILEFFEFTQTPVEILPCSLDVFRTHVEQLLQETE